MYLRYHVQIKYQSKINNIFIYLFLLNKIWFDFMSHTLTHNLFTYLKYWVIINDWTYKIHVYSFDI